MLANVETASTHRRDGTMAVIQNRRAPQAAADEDRAPAVTGERRGGGQVGRRLWALLNAQALLNGTAGSPGGVIPAEDDRQRLAGRRGAS
jgi:hypothetical protein